MRWADLRVGMIAMGVVAFVASAAGIGVPATYGAQVTADEPQYLLSALSIAEDGDLDIADELADERWRQFHEAQLPRQTQPLSGGRQISPHGPLLPLVMAPGVAAGGWVGGKLVLATMAGMLAALLVWTAVRRFEVPPWPATLTVAVFSLSAPLAVYGSQVYPELPAALATTAGVAAVAGPLRRGGLWALATAVVALPWLATKYVPVAATLAVLALLRLWRSGRIGAAAGFALGLAASGVLFLWLHQMIYGGWTPYAAGDHFAGRGEFSAVGFDPSPLGRSRRLVGLFVDRDFGLAAWQPAWLLAVPAFAALVRHRHWPLLFWPFAVGWLIATFAALTMQGWWWPGRQTVVVLPCAVLAVAWWAARLPVVRPALAVLGLLGVASYAWLTVEGLAGRLTWVVDFASTTNPWYRVWRMLLPDYLGVTGRTWLLHSLWIAVLLVSACAALRATRRPREISPAPG